MSRKNVKPPMIETAALCPHVIGSLRSLRQTRPLDERKGRLQTALLLVHNLREI